MDAPCSPASGVERVKAPTQRVRRRKTKFPQARSARIAHELKNCMAALILGVAGMEYAAEQPTASVSQTAMLEKTIQKMNRLIDELVALSERGRSSRQRG